MVGTGRLRLLRGGEVGLWPCHKILTFSSWARAQEVWETLGGSPEHPEQWAAVAEGGRHSPAVAGSGGSPPGSYMVEEARLVSSCLSLPSRARPRFSRLAASVGVTEYVLEKVELAGTFSLEGVGEESSEPAPAWWVPSTLRGCSASRGQNQTRPAAACARFLLSFPSTTTSFFAHLLRGAEAAAGGSCAPSPGTSPAEAGAHVVRSLPSPLLPLGLLF